MDLLLDWCFVAGRLLLTASWCFAALQSALDRWDVSVKT